MQITTRYKEALDRAAMKVYFGNHQIPGTGKIDDFQRPPPNPAEPGLRNKETSPVLRFCGNL